MKHWRRRRRHAGGSDAAPLTPAQVQVVRERQEHAGARLVRLFVVACFVGTISLLTLFASLDAQTYRGVVVLSLVDAILLVVAFLIIVDGRELQGAVMALVVVSLQILWVVRETSAAVSLESLLFPIALAPFLVVRRDLPALRLALSSFAIGVYLVSEFAFPDGAGAHPLDGDIAAAFARGNRIGAGVAVVAIVAVIQTNMSATRQVLEGAARYGELRATTDELTGVYNRRPVIAQLNQWAERGRGNYAIALIDVDYFKTINDEFGHDCGDTMIQAVALTLRSHFREADMVSRWGGDEFLVLMPGIRHFDVLPVLERLRHAVNLIEKPCGAHVHHVTVSIGASMGTTGQTPDECIAAADHALYRAKEEGRNRVVAVGVSEAMHALGRPSPDEPVSLPAGDARRL